MYGNRSASVCACVGEYCCFTWFYKAFFSGHNSHAMRLWSLHPQYLDPQGLVALWREALLAQAVLQGNTRGYRAHPQLERFWAQASPIAAIGSYLLAVCSEASLRGYSFDRSKIVAPRRHRPIVVTAGQLEHEWRHFMGKLSVRNVELHQRWGSVRSPECHPLFEIGPGGIEPWERQHGAST
jgi:hypothetical protein